MKVYELTPIDGRKSFYGKAKVVIEGDKETLYSYDTPIIVREKGNLTPLYKGNKYGLTTSRHVKAFCGLNKAEYMKLLKEKEMI